MPEKVTFPAAARSAYRRACSLPRDPVPSTATRKPAPGSRIGSGLCHPLRSGDNWKFGLFCFAIWTNRGGAVVIIAYILTALAAYLLGSIPTGFLVGKARGIDLRKMGSGNIGATNAFRQLGTFPGILVLFVDALKGWVAVMGTLVICHWLWPSAKDLERE